MSVLRRMPIRLRLTLAYVLVMAVVLAAAGTFLYLRQKIDRPFGLASIETVRGAGYRMRADGGRAA